ncbi:hypothetical protein TanjilG_27047 [Lupinus angustifolius]|uniref:WRKY domain-containing protein n=1 Tax=Lupinus angustifolius TaxID=3871 RepID=A0A4P1QVT1_LUPAN|nr:PREDICTED: probable WRKY transcription factor 23 [Lupinus angustifolius]OIV95943.1 hypothetical protein TanjilG_27047 [Lupinus angustifolius]
MNANTSILNNNNNNKLFLSSEIVEEDASSTIFPTTLSNEIASYGFMELITVPDYNSPLFDWLPTLKAETDTDEEIILVSSVVQNTSVVSLTSPTSINIMKEQQHHQGNNALMSNGVVERRNKERKQKEQRYVIHANTNVTNIEDGFKWRKYGQKYVKNNHFPRSYYRCTTLGCNVKKRVERSSEDNNFVITTYEGNHTHLPPNTPRIISFNLIHNGGTITNSSGGVGFLPPSPPPPPQQYQHLNQPIIPHHHFHHPNVQQQQQQSEPFLFSTFVEGDENHGGEFVASNNSTPPMSDYMNSTSSSSGYVEEHENNGEDFGSSDDILIDNEALLRNNGMLEDILMCHLG